MIQHIRTSAGRALLVATLLSPCLPGPAAAQEDPSASGWTFSVAGEVVSQYIWRGLELDAKPNLQPDISVSHGDVSIGMWSSWSLRTNYKEIDTYLSWTKELSAGELSLTGTDYYYPYLEGDLGSFTNFGGVVDGEATGAHTIELGAAFTPTVAPLTLTLGWNAYNDPDHALFAQVSSQVSLPFVDLDGDVGFLLKDSPNYYGNDAGHAMDYTLRATRSLTLGTVEPYVSVAVIRSPVADKKTYWVFAVGF